MHQAVYVSPGSATPSHSGRLTATSLLAMMSVRCANGRISPPIAVSDAHVHVIGFASCRPLPGGPLGDSVCIGGRPVGSSPSPPPPPRYSLTFCFPLSHLCRGFPGFVLALLLDRYICLPYDVFMSEKTCKVVTNVLCSHFYIIRSALRQLLFPACNFLH